MTIRSEGQFNTVVYEDYDRYRGQDRRDLIMIAKADRERLGLAVDQRITVRSACGEMANVLVSARSIPSRGPPPSRTPWWSWSRPEAQRRGRARERRGQPPAGRLAPADARENQSSAEVPRISELVCCSSPSRVKKITSFTGPMVSLVGVWVKSQVKVAVA
jgi:hypothetical protein